MSKLLIKLLFWSCVILSLVFFLSLGCFIRNATILIVLGVLCLSNCFDCLYKLILFVGKLLF